MLKEWWWWDLRGSRPGVGRCWSERNVHKTEIVEEMQLLRKAGSRLWPFEYLREWRTEIIGGEELGTRGDEKPSVWGFSAEHGGKVGLARMVLVNFVSL